ncbi:H(+)/Cl(-) exchange transporter ClcA [Pseudoxanthobacter sp.]|uniref:H(+)/Cl(-) exchange transporter ClcA n=1 Tax=Pseudoxanthobacter sp. TaxID=1925742 RepID=UPI002FE0B396
MSNGNAATHRTTSDGVYYLLAAVVGVLVGAIGSVFHIAVEFLLDWPKFVIAHISGPLVYPVLAAVAMAMVLLSVYLVRRFAPEAAGSGVQEIEGAMEGLRTLHWWRVLPVKFFGGILSLGAGLVAGREGPTIHMGASISEAFTRATGLGLRDGRGLMAAGAAAGLAAAFSAPLAAVLFVIEETRRQFPYGFRTYTAVIVCSAASGAVTVAIGGARPFLFLEVPDMPLTLLPAFIVLGALLGGVGVLFNAGVLTGLESADKVGRRFTPYLWPAVVAAAIGVLALLRPEATQGGEGLVLTMAHEHLGVLTLAVIVVIRFVMTMASYSTGAPGGIFAPILAMATAFGLLFGGLLDLVVTLPPGTSTAFAVAAMGGLFTATVRAPLVGMVLVAELTGAYSLFLPVIVTCVMANIVAEALKGRPIYEQLLERTLRLAGQTPGVRGDDEAIGGWDEKGRRHPDHLMPDRAPPRA